MKNNKKVFVILSILFCCIFAFSGCSFSLFGSSNSSNSSTKSTSVYYSSKQYTENETVETSSSMSLSEIAQKYIDITFTVRIKKIVETTKNGITTTSSTFSSFGSGFIIHKGGFILTNNHVVSSVVADPVSSIGYNVTTETYYKCFVSQDGGETNYEAKVLWNNATLDMAIIVCQDFATLPAAKIKDRTISCNSEDKIKLLEEVIAIGTPVELENYATVTTGTISQTKLRNGISDSNVYEKLIQHTAPINHGNSGGPLIDTTGNVIGINTLGLDDANSVFYAISIYPATIIIDKVVENFYKDGSSTIEILVGMNATDKEEVKILSKTEITVSEEGLYVTYVGTSCIINNLEAGDYIVGLDITLADDSVKSYEVTDKFTFLYARLALLYAKSAVFKINRGGNIVNLAMSV